MAFLVGAEGLIERRPRRGELFESGCSFSQGIGASVQKFDGITIAHRFDKTAAGPFSSSCRNVRQAALPSLRPGADGFLDGRPVLFLIRFQLQRALDDRNPCIRESI